MVTVLTTITITVVIIGGGGMGVLETRYFEQVLAT